MSDWYNCCCLTFVLVCLGLDAEDGHNGDDYDDGGGGQGHHKPRLTVEGLGFRVPILQVHLRRGRYLTKTTIEIYIFRYLLCISVVNPDIAQISTFSWDPDCLRRRQ